MPSKLKLKGRDVPAHGATCEDAAAKSMSTESPERRAAPAADDTVNS